MWCKRAGGGSPVGVGGVDAGHELAVGSARGGEVLVAFLELDTQVDDVLFERQDLLFELVDVVGRAEPGLAPAARGAATERFLHATVTGDLAALLELLAPNATLGADGGGGSKFKTPLRPIHGADKIARVLVAVGRHALPPGATVEITEVNGGPAAVLVGPAGAIGVLQVDLGDDKRVTDARMIGNPDKLGGLAALGGPGDAGR